MKEINEIDELFRSKLSGHKNTPSTDLKEVFMKKVAPPKQRKIIPIWYYASAAAVLFALGFAMFSSNSNEPVSTVAANLPSSNTPAGEAIVIDNQPLHETDESVEQMIVKATIKPATMAKVLDQKTTHLNKSTIPKAITKAADIPSKPSRNSMILDEAIPDELTIAYLESEQKENVVAESKDAEAGGLFQKEIGETVVIIATDPVQEETIFLPRLNQDSNMTLAEATEIAEEQNKQEKSFIAKVFTELKHLKHGERVDVNTLASNINDSDSFIGHEAEEFKDRWNWIKNRVSKK